jgi:hypothetical protein
MSERWFRTSGGRTGAGVVVLPWIYVGDEVLVGAEAWVSGEHVMEVAAQGPVITGELASLGDLRPGDKCLIMVATDGTPGPHVIKLHVKAAGDRERWLTVEVPEDDDSLVVIERPEPPTVEV